jgi:E3 Ubiquitin ligase
VILCLSLFPANHLTLLSALAIAGGLYFLFVGFRLSARKRRLLATPTSNIGAAALGPVEIHGTATGPNTMPAPITGKPCFLYRTTVWQLREGKGEGKKKEEWEKIADETLHLPFFLHDSTGQLLVEPLGADLSLDHDFREEFAPREGDVPPRVSVFLSRHGIVPSCRLRIDERLIKSDDALFIAGTLTKNPGIQVRPFSPGRNSPNNGRNPAFSESDQRTAPQIIQLSSGSAPSNTRDMSQQAKIAAALNRAGILKPEAWSAAGIPYNPAAVEENAAPAPSPASHEVRSQKQTASEANFNLNPPVVLMKGGNDPAFVVSHRSQKEFAEALAWKSLGMVCGGTTIALLGVYVLLTQLRLP